MKRKYKNIYRHKSPVAYKNRAYSDCPLSSVHSTPTTITAEGGVLGTGTKVLQNHLPGNSWKRRDFWWGGICTVCTVCSTNLDSRPNASGQRRQLTGNPGTRRAEIRHTCHKTPEQNERPVRNTVLFKGTQVFWLRFWNFCYFFISYVKILRFYKKIFW